MTPIATPVDAERLRALGARLRAVRKAQKVSAVAASQAAGISRVTLHRIESGEPTVAIGAWIAVAGALGQSLEFIDPAARPLPPLPDRIRIGDYPQLKQLAWQLTGVDELTPREALDIYERNWRHVDTAALSAGEAELVRALSVALGGGRLLV